MEIRNYKLMEKEDFETIYITQKDPWDAGDAKDPSYDMKLDMLKSYAPVDIIFDIGSGRGAFTKRLSTLCKKIIGYEISSAAVSQARARFPEIQFENLDLAEKCPETDADIIVVSEVVYYLTFIRRLQFIENIYRSTRNLVLFAYYTMKEKEDIFLPWLKLYFDIIDHRDIGHTLLLMKRKELIF